MTKQRFVDTRDQSFYGNYLYDQVVPKTHFLRLLNQLIDLDRFTQRLIELYRGGGEYGRPPFNDSVHSVANVNTAKDQKRKDSEKGPHDPDAKWGVKHSKKVKDQRGNDITQVEYFFGYKGHMSMNAESNLITSVEVTSGEVYDGHHFCTLVDHDLEQNLPVETYAADRGYDDGNNHFYLQHYIRRQRAYFCAFINLMAYPKMGFSRFQK